MVREALTIILVPKSIKLDIVAIFINTGYCNHYNSDSLPLPKLNSTTLYFNNIDGFKTNFSEFLSNRVLHNHNFPFYCFNETNIHENCTENFEIEGYTSEFLHAIEGKSKGSGLAI